MQSCQAAQSPAHQGHDDLVTLRVHTEGHRRLEVLTHATNAQPPRRPAQCDGDNGDEQPREVHERALLS